MTIRDATLFIDISTYYYLEFGIKIYGIYAVRLTIRNTGDSPAYIDHVIVEDTDTGVWTVFYKERPAVISKGKTGEITFGLEYLWLVGPSGVYTFRIIVDLGFDTVSYTMTITL